eukprot:scaffold20483_cov52-Phaeocystis_antarctica.AAC.2
MVITQEFEDEAFHARGSGMYGQTPELGDVRNVAPKTRADRNAALHREDLEKSRLRARREGYYRHAIDRSIDSRVSRATRLAHHTVPRCWVPHSPRTHARRWVSTSISISIHPSIHLSQARGGGHHSTGGLARLDLRRRPLRDGRRGGEQERARRLDRQAGADVLRQAAEQRRPRGEALADDRDGGRHGQPEV